jgi:hypothetical protein
MVSYHQVMEEHGAIRGDGTLFIIYQDGEPVGIGTERIPEIFRGNAYQNLSARSGSARSALDFLETSRMTG